MNTKLLASFILGVVAAAAILLCCDGIYDPLQMMAIPGGIMTIVVSFFVMGGHKA